MHIKVPLLTRRRCRAKTVENLCLTYKIIYIQQQQQSLGVG
uniref:Uncharacterized protein n=1 Tax=Arundo donax TaxID=35708 RepID=A0A0A8ZSG2_ARUDO